MDIITMRYCHQDGFSKKFAFYRYISQFFQYTLILVMAKETLTFEMYMIWYVCQTRVLFYLFNAKLLLLVLMHMCYS